MNYTETAAKDVTRLRGLAPAFYLLSVLLIVYPLLEVSAGMASFSPTEVRWRYGTVGLLMDGSLLPLAGVLLAVTTAHLLGHQRTQPALQLLGGVVLAVMALTAAMFVLDAIQLRASVRTEVMPLYDRLSLKALAMLLANMLFVATVSYSSFLTSRRIRRAENAARRGPSHPRIRVPQIPQQ